MKNFFHNLKVTAVGLAIVAVVIGFSYGGFQIERWIHYKFGYKDKIEEQIQPLGDRLDNIEKRLSVIEKQLGITTITNK